MYEVGQTVFVEKRYVGLASVKVSAVGRKWVTLDNGSRFDKNTGWLDGGQYSSPGRVWESEAAYQEHIELREAFICLARKLGYAPKPGVTAMDIHESARLLRITLDNNEE